MTKTKYYDLQMDDPQDDYDVEVVNANLKKIDEQMKIRENATDALQEPEFTVADKRENIASKEKISKILGKIAKFFTDLKTVAFTGSYKDLSNKPTSLPASDVSAWAKANTKPTYTKAEVGLGNVDNTADANKSVKYATSAGNATKVNNYTVNANVPSGAKFTDTTYGVATTTKTGIVKPDGKTITADKDGTLHGADTIKVDGITITRDDATKVIALAKTLQDKIGTIGNKVDKNYVVNNLTTTKQGFVLDGRQGKALQDQITSLNGSLNNRLTGSRFTTTDTTTLSDIKNYIHANMNPGLSFMQIFDGKSKFFNTSGNWLMIGFAQDQVSGCILAVNHWSSEVKIIVAYNDPSGNKMLKISNIPTTDSKDI